MCLTLLFWLPNASTAAASIDLLFWFITAVTIFFSIGIFAAIVFYGVRYRRGTKVDRSNPPQYNSIVELVWTIIPLVIVIGMFFWSSAVWIANARIPANALEIYVTGKQWMWKAQHPEGRWENNTLHVPLGRPVVLTMTSEDVIHAFYVPAFRLKKDVVPGEYTQLAFTPTKAGDFHLFCAEFCGTLHSQMVGTVTVMQPSDYEKWLREGSVPQSMAEEGRRLFISNGCSGCHGANASVRAPRLEGVYGRPVPIQIPRPGVPLEKIAATTITADNKYIHDSILLPEKQVRAGFRPIMPTFKNRLTEEQILKIVAYIKSLSQQTPTENVSPNPTSALSAEDYRSRTGFVPTNIKGLK
jgi:cytochrome c oxidase subunit 2